MRNTHDPRTAAVSSLPSLHLPALRLLAVAALLGFAPAAVLAEDWYRIESGDGKASVLFPNRAEEVRELVDKTPGGKVVTRVAEHQDESVMLTISETKLPRLAMSFAGPKLIFSYAKGIVLNKAFGKEISSEPQEIGGADAAIVMRYEAVDFEDENHPGYAGLAVFLIVDTHIYVVNSMLSKATPDARAVQEKLLGSIQVHE